VIKETKLEGIWMYHMLALGPASRKKRGTEKAQGNKQKDDLGYTATADGNPLQPDSGRANGRGFERKHRVYYFSGGGFRSPPSGEHWRFLAQLAQDLAGHRSSVTFPGSQRSVDPESDAKIELIMVSYPLAPTSPASESLRVLRNWLRRVMDDAVANKETLSLMGDSSGGNIIMSLGFWAVEHYEVKKPPPSPTVDQSSAGVNDGPDSKGERESQRTHFPLTSLLTISGPMDLTNSSPEVHRADALDCVLTEEMTKVVADIWCGHDRNRPSQYPPIPLSSPEVSPLFQPDAAFRALRDKKLNVHGVYGTHDVLSPSGIEFMKKCQKLGVRGRWLVWEGQMHCFPLAAGGDRLGIREGREARKFVESVLRADAEMED
jgi:acetyl esterase/lipase